MENKQEQLKADPISNVEYNRLSHEEFRKLPPEKRCNCADCFYLTGAINLWCTNEEAKKDRGTSIPGVNLCPHWEQSNKNSLTTYSKTTKRITLWIYLFFAVLLFIILLIAL